MDEIYSLEIIDDFLSFCSLKKTYIPEDIISKIPKTLIAFGKSLKIINPKKVAIIISKYCNGANTDTSANLKA